MPHWSVLHLASKWLRKLGLTTSRTNTGEWVEGVAAHYHIRCICDLWYRRNRWPANRVETHKLARHVSTTSSLSRLGKSATSLRPPEGLLFALFGRGCMHGPVGEGVCVTGHVSGRARQLIRSGQEGLRWFAHGTRCLCLALFPFGFATPIFLTSPGNTSTALRQNLLLSK